jgi:Flp pilus assembly protein TadD
MSPYATRQNYLARFYQKYLHDLDTAGFIRQVSTHYEIPALHRMAGLGSVNDRRAAVLALGFLGNYSSNAIVARLLRDSDRGVRMLAEQSIHEIWMMAGTDWQRRRLLSIRRQVNSGRLTQAQHLASLLTDAAPDFAEAWNERAVASFHLGRAQLALQECQTVVRINPFQFKAMVGAGHCCNSLRRPNDALVWYRRAIGVHPGLEQVRHEVQRLRRLLNRA